MEIKWCSGSVSITEVLFSSLSAVYSGTPVGSRRSCPVELVILRAGEGEISRGSKVLGVGEVVWKSESGGWDIEFGRTAVAVCDSKR